MEDSAILNINVNKIPLYSTVSPMANSFDIITLIFSMNVPLTLGDIVYLSLTTFGGATFTINTTLMNPYWTIKRVV
jgi:hypothetical protein